MRHPGRSRTVDLVSVIQSARSDRVCDTTFKLPIVISEQLYYVTVFWPQVCALILLHHFRAVRLGMENFAM